MTADRRLETVTLTVQIPREVALAAKAGRRALLPVFPAGRPPMNDDRSVLFTAEDRDSLTAAFLKARTPLPLLYDHGKGPRGGLAGGRLIRLVPQEDGGLKAEASLTPRAAREIEAGEWFATSAKFRAWRDPAGNLRPAELRHLSLVPEPAIDGMDEIQLLSAEEAGDPIDDLIAEAGGPAPDAPTPRPETGTGQTPSPDEARSKKETEMPDATAPPAPAPATGGTGGTETKPENKPETQTAEMAAGAKAGTGDVELAARIDKLVTERVGKVLDELSRRQKVTDLVEMAAKSGRITVGQRKAAEKLAAADPEAFEEFCRLAPRLSPTGVNVTGRTADVSLATETFSAADMNDPESRRRLMEAAVELAAREKVELDVALSRLIGVTN